MADRRPEDTAAGARQGDLGERVKAAYASPANRRPEPSDGGGAGRAERVAAAVATAGKSSKHAVDASPDQAKQGGKGVRRVRRAHLRLIHVDPWSVMKTSFLLSVAIGIVMVVAVGIVWTVLDAAGVWDSIDSTVVDLVGDNGAGFRIEDYLGMSRVIGFTLIIAVVDVVLLTVIATLGAFLYNLAAALLGGVEVVLAEDDR